MGMVSSGPLTLCQAFGCIPACLGKHLSILVVLSYDLSLWPGNGVESKWRGGDFFFYIDPTNFCLGCRQKKVVNVKPWELIYIYIYIYIFFSLPILKCGLGMLPVLRRFLNCSWNTWGVLSCKVGYSWGLWTSTWQIWLGPHPLSLA